MLTGMKLRSNEEVVAEVEVYFADKGKSFYKKSIESVG